MWTMCMKIRYCNASWFPGIRDWVLKVRDTLVSRVLASSSGPCIFIIAGNNIKYTSWISFLYSESHGCAKRSLVLYELMHISIPNEKGIWNVQNLVTLFPVGISYEIVWIYGGNIEEQKKYSFYVNNTTTTNALNMSIALNNEQNRTSNPRFMHGLNQKWKGEEIFQHLFKQRKFKI